MGGLLSLMHAGLTQDRNIRNLVTVRQPDRPARRRRGRRSGPVALDAPARLVRKYSDFRLISVDPQKLTNPGWLLALGFKMTSPIASITTYWDLMTQLWDREFVEKHSTTSNYLNRMLIYPGVRGPRHAAADGDRQRTGYRPHPDRTSELPKSARSRRQRWCSPAIATPSSRRRSRGRSSICCLRRTRPGDWHRAATWVWCLAARPRAKVWGPAADWLAERSQPKVVRKRTVKKKP